MKFWRYIQGDRKGKEAHRIEKEAMKDPFLADALEGYEKAQGSHQREVTRLQKEITRRQKRITSKSIHKKPNHIKTWSIAASVLIVIGTGAWFLLEYTPVAKDIRLEEAAPAIAELQETEIVRDSMEKIPEKRPIAQATPSKVDIPKEIIQDVTVIAEEKVQEAEAKVMVQPATEATLKDEVNPTSPQPVTGMQAYMDYIQRNKIHPTDGECANATGAVVVEFQIGQSGRPYNIRVTQGLCSSINKEAIRLIINGPDWKKGQTSDETSITIHFQKMPE